MSYRRELSILWRGGSVDVYQVLSGTPNVENRASSLLSFCAFWLLWVILLNFSIANFWLVASLMLKSNINRALEW